MIDYLLDFSQIIKKIAAISIIEISNDPLHSTNFIVGSLEFYIPIEGKLDVEKEKNEIQKELSYVVGFLKSVEAKLSNEKFIANAKPEVIENEQKKKADAEAKLYLLQKTLDGLN